MGFAMAHGAANAYGPCVRVRLDVKYSYLRYRCYYSGGGRWWVAIEAGT
jgi:hypothetical protein